VLLVDDDPMVRETYEAILKTEGWSVLTASDAEEALQVVATEDPSAVLLDVQMAGRDGLAVVEALALWYPHMLPRVALHSGYSTEARVAAAAQRHGLVVLQKPTSVTALTKALAEIADRGARKPLAGLAAQPSRSTSPDVSL
jgi:CheY-like chemotaxis protein